MNAQLVELSVDVDDYCGVGGYSNVVEQCSRDVGNGCPCSWTGAEFCLDLVLDVDRACLYHDVMHRITLHVFLKNEGVTRGRRYHFRRFGLLSNEIVDSLN